MDGDQRALQLLYEGECAKTLELRATAAKLEAQYSEALADRDSLQTALSAALHRLSGADACTRTSRTDVGETQGAVGWTQIIASQPWAQPEPEPEKRLQERGPCRHADRPHALGHKDISQGAQGGRGRWRCGRARVPRPQRWREGPPD